MNLKQNENTKEKRRRTTLTYTKGEKTLAYSSLTLSLVQDCSMYRQKKGPEGKTRPNQRVDPPNCRENADRVSAAIPGIQVPDFAPWLRPAARIF